ncbi:5-oxoprolinase subunit C family protein [Tenacibaculum xiamenense]|uniref:5-oxoprolinase subunit C family protein n=1 Tax=Tenacibaculum xiamenense TaxID=1261553 RepID=UPI0038964945
MIKVVSPGFYASIQDLGRNGYCAIGVPVSGVMDSYSAKLANILLGNNIDDAVIEVFFGGVRLQFLEDCYLCISGADFSVEINNELIKLNVPFLASKGSELRFGKRKYGARTYIGVKGGVNIETVLGSRSWYSGITPVMKLEKEMLLPVNTAIDYQLDIERGVLKSPMDHFVAEEVECFKGPEFDLLSVEQKKILLSEKYTISGDNSRMGYRLHEEVSNNFDSMLTSSVLPGTVQLTPSGKLVVLMRDCQVTGGYPRVLQLSEEGINRLAQKTTNDGIRFVFVK